MKKLWTISIVAVIAVCLATVGCLENITEVSAVNGAGNTTIAVSGTGILEVEPDKVTVSLGVETQSDNVTEALAQNSEKMDAVIAALKRRGVPEDSIETSYFSIYPVKDYERPVEGIVGYRVTNAITVELSDLDTVGHVIDTAITAGANRVTNVEFGLTDAKEQDLRQEALREACGDARLKADAIAGGLGLKIIGVATAREGGVYTYPYRAGGFEEAAMYSGGAPMAVPTAIEPNDVTVSATVQVDYKCL
jgi:uncharacterized protein YggE